MRRSPGARSRSAEAPGRSPSAARRPSWTALAGQRVERVAPARQVPHLRARPRPRRRQPDAHRAVPARRAGDEAADEDGGRRSASARGRAAADAARMDARGGLAARRRRRARGPLPRPDPDGQGLPAAGRRRPAGPRASADEIGPGRRRPGPRRSRSGGSASAGTRASSRTCCATRRSWPASATPTATRSCTRRGSLPFRKRSTLARRGGRRALRGDPVDAGDGDRRPARARAADVRDAGPRLPGRPRQGRPAVSALRHADHRGRARRRS